MNRHYSRTWWIAMALCWVAAIVVIVTGEDPDQALQVVSR